MKRQTRKHHQNTGFTLIEVMITMFLISMMCLGVFAGLQQITKAMAAVALRDEAYHLMQGEAERLLAADYTNFTASDWETIHSSFKTSFTPAREAAFAVPAGNAGGRTDFSRRVLDVTPDPNPNPNSRTLRVEVQWTWQKRKTVVSTTLFRTQS